MEKIPKLNRSDVVYKINYAGGDSSSKITTRHMLIGKKSVYLVESVLKFVAWNNGIGPDKLYLKLFQVPSHIISVFFEHP